MKKITLAVLFMFLSAHVMALSFQFSIYAFSVSALRASMGTGGNNNVAILNGTTNMVLAPVSYSGSGAPTLANTGSSTYFSFAMSRCPNYCDIQSLANNLTTRPGQQMAYSNISNDLSGYSKSYYNCLMLNSSYVSTVTSSSSVANVYVLAWVGAGGKNQFVYIGCDASNQPIQSALMTDGSAQAFQIAIP